MSKGKQLAFNTAIVGLSKISSILAIFLVLPIYTKYLTAEDYGYFDLVMAYGLLFVPIIMLRLEVAIFRWLVDARGNNHKIAGIVTNVLQIVVLSLLAFTLLYWVGVGIFSLKYPFLIYGYLVFAVFSGVTLQVARGLGKIKQFAVGGVVSGVLSMLIGALLVTMFDMRLDGVLWGLMLGYCVALGYNVIAMRLWRYIRGQSSKQLKNELISFSLPMIPNGLSGWVTMHGTRAIVAGVMGVAANGIYAVAVRFTSLFGGLYEVFNVTWTESASVHIKAKDRNQFFSQTFDVALRFFGSAAIGVIAVMPIIFPLLVDDSFIDAYYYVPLLIFAFFLDIIVRMIGAIYVALRLTKQVMYTTVTAAAISLAGTFMLIPFMGLWGAVIATTIAFGAMAVFRYYDIRRRGVSVRIRIPTMLILLLIYVFVTVVYYLDNINMVIHVLTVLVAIIVFLCINRTILKEILKFTKERISKK